ncbi:MAG: hypothetical protein ACMUEL_01585 [Flavobacteriales bacterium Tduv]
MEDQKEKREKQISERKARAKKETQSGVDIQEKCSRNQVNSTTDTKSI